MRSLEERLRDYRRYADSVSRVANRLIYTKAIMLGICRECRNRDAQATNQLCPECQDRRRDRKLKRRLAGIAHDKA